MPDEKEKIIDGEPVVCVDDGEQTDIAERSESDAELPPDGAEGAKRKRSKKIRIPFWLLITVCYVAALIAALVYFNVDWKKQDNNIPEYVQPGAGNKVGDTCYDFELPSYCDRGDFKLSDHRGEIVLINFWYTTCGPCVAEMPIINKIAEKYDITAVAIHSALITENPSTDMSGVQRYIDAHEDAYTSGKTWKDYAVTFLQDQPIGALTSPTFDLLGGKNSYPMTVIVDQNGVIKYTRQGSITEALLEAQMALLNAKMR